MSELPTIDQSKVAQKLLAKASQSSYEAVQLEVLAEMLRDERDDALEKLRIITSERDSLLAERDLVQEEDSNGGV